MKRTAIFLFLVLLLLVATGCTKVTGGGWISLEGGGKATFGFNLQCDPDTGEVHGRFSYNDHQGVRFKATALEVGDVEGQEGECMGEGNQSIFEGTYTPKGIDDPLGGDFRLVVVDNGEGNAIDDDYFWLVLTGGEYDGYEVQGPLGGGNVQIN